MKLAFGILSARERPDAVVQLVRSLGSAAPVFVHHDATKQPPPPVANGSVRLVDDPVVTGWGEWSLCRAITRLLRSACDEPDWDYLQLLSASCLPIKPIARFEQFVAASPFDVHMDQVRLDDDAIALMSHGFRGYAAADTVGHRVLRRLRRWYLDASTTSVDRQGLGFAVPARDRAARAPARLAVRGMHWVTRGGASLFGHPFTARYRCHVGSTWWGARREAIEFVAQQPDDGVLQRYFARVLVPDEFYFQTLLANAGFALGESNHLISRFQGPHPVALTPDDIPVLQRSPRFFARKFPDDPQASVRAEVLESLVTDPLPSFEPT